MITSYFNTLLAPEKGRGKGFIALEKMALAYIILTTLFVIALYPRLANPVEMLLGRAGVTLLIFALRKFYTLYPSKLSFFIRVAAHLGLLAYWYPDTYEINRVFTNLDHHFANAEQWLFNCQPALLFSQTFSSPIWSEAFNLGYYAYYPMIAVVSIFYFGWAYRAFERATFILVGSFFAYYLVYMFLPVAGPQFYFLAIGVDSAEVGHFPQIFDYFNYNRDILTAPGYTDGLFYKLVTAAQAEGERPTAAFPSSHIGVSTILLILAYRVKKSLFWSLTPFYVLLCCATVYIQAHYVIDGIAGVLSALLCYAIMASIAKKWIPLFPSKPQ